MTLRADSPCVSHLHASPNCEPRRGVVSPDMLLLHYTGLKSCTKAIDWLARPESKVSCHYVVDEAGRITQMVPEALRAWHAGVSSWAGETDINSASIGIEIHNPGHAFGYPDFPGPQMDAVVDLCRDILARNPIPAERVLAHSDVAPTRKIDPGEKFDWRRLAEAGIGHWVEPAPIAHQDAGVGAGETSPAVARTQSALARYGYGIAPSGIFDADTAFVVGAFQRHFRPARVDGRIDRSTVLTLERLLATLGEGTIS